MDLITELRQHSGFLTTKEVMTLLKTRRGTLCAWVREGRIPAMLVGKGYLFDPRLLADWLSERAIGSRAVVRKHRLVHQPRG